MNQNKLDKRLQECYRELVDMGYDVSIVSPEEIKVKIPKMSDVTPKEKPVKK